jgi:PAS domain S-box-containing protein
MWKNFKISSKITIMVILAVLISATTIGFISYRIAARTSEKNIGAGIQAVNNARAAEIDATLSRVHTAIAIVQNSETSIAALTGEISGGDEGGFGLDFSFDGEDEEDEMDMDMDMDMDSTSGGEEVGSFLQNLSKNLGLGNITLVKSNGKIAATTDASIKVGAGFPDPDKRTLNRASAGFYISNVVANKPGVVYAAAPVKRGDNGLVIVEVDLNSVFRTLSDTTGLGKTAESLLVRYDSVNGKLNTLNPPRLYEAGTIISLSRTDRAATGWLKAFGKKAGTGIFQDYRSQEALTAYTYLPGAEWGLITKIDLDEISANKRQFLINYLIIGLLILVLAAFLSTILSRVLINPILSLKATAQMLGRGILPERVEKESNDEIGMMAQTLDQLVQALRRTANFANKIGKGEFDAEFEALSENDALGTSLLNMRENLIESEKRDKERNWIVTGMAEVGEILRMHDHLDTLGDDIIKYIIGKIGALQGAFYVVNDDDSDQIYIEMHAVYAYGRKKYLQRNFKFAEGLVGQAAAEQDSVLRTEIPDNYVSITSGILGDQKPGCILIVPLIAEETVYGVLEFAGLQRFTSGEVKLVEELSVILARTVYNIKVNERTRRLLEESQALSQELQEKQEVLRQNAEEMQATQEELKRSNVMLEEQVEEVNRTQKRMQLLLENASEVITIYEKEGTIRYISPSVEPILGYHQNEMIGTSDMDKVHADNREAVEHMFERLLESPEEQVTIQYAYRLKTGEYIWIESTGTNFLSNPAIQGIIVNSRDITEKRRAEQEQRMRSKMQALSENSPDLITRLDNGGPISYINPVIESYTGKSPEHYLNKNVQEADLNTNILETWLRIVEEVNQSNEKVAMEMDFPSEMGNRVMQVNAIPEFDEEEKLESVLVVSHDITDRKVIELEIQNKNKKINDSINYAKRIQNAILPNTHIINRALNNSFILYKPKDVVSGDFPWYVQTKTDIFMAAVDCTGHGVPGALLSLIGYFLLNDIVRSRKITDPGVILDQLDEGVTETLRQDQDDSETKDGMDIALCRINTAERKVEYAGAHRPLYVMKKGEMEEIKGNKFAIGGGIYKNQTKFTNHKLQLSKGDTIFFCSDGFPDQFGGPDNRKFGPRQLRDIISRVHDMPMMEACKIFDHEWEAWRGDHKQTDDVLLIGIKF